MLAGWHADQSWGLAVLDGRHADGARSAGWVEIGAGGTRWPAVRDGARGSELAAGAGRGPAGRSVSDDTRSRPPAHRRAGWWHAVEGGGP